MAVVYLKDEGQTDKANSYFLYFSLSCLLSVKTIRLKKAFNVWKSLTLEIS